MAAQQLTYWRRTLVERAYSPMLATATKLVVEPVLGARYLSLADERQRWWGLDADERRDWVDNTLHEILTYASNHVPAYMGLPARLAEFPVVDKQTIIDQSEAYLSDEHEKLPVVSKHTGGTTGDPWNYPLDRVAWAESYATQIYRFRELGVEYGDRRLLLGFPASLGLNQVSASRRLRMLAERTDPSLSTLEVNHSDSLARAEEACRRDVRLWYGYASTLAGMAAAVLDAGRSLPGPPVIVTMAEPLTPAWRDDIAAAFGSTVVEEYGCNDGGIMAHRCAAGHLHLADHQSLVEILDETGRPCAPGRSGSIVMTNFHARHMPFIRYNAGDIGVAGPEDCPCGRPGKTLAAVLGRSGETIRLRDGTDVIPTAFFLPFNQVQGVRRWQMVQPDPTSIIVRVDTRPGWSQEEKDLIVDWVRQRTGEQADVRLTTTEPFEISRGGKHRVIIRHF